MQKDELTVAIEKLIADLSLPLQQTERESGWNEALKARWLNWFIDLQNSIAEEKTVPPGWGILRAMNFDGVDPSDLARQASRIGRMLGRIDIQDSQRG